MKEPENGSWKLPERNGASARIQVAFNCRI
jgi:hypothetical protein